MVKIAQNLNRSNDSIKHICCYSIVLMCYNGSRLCAVWEIEKQKLNYAEKFI
jgi:hypothetical protein